MDKIFLEAKFKDRGKENPDGTAALQDYITPAESLQYWSDVDVFL